MTQTGNLKGQVRDRETGEAVVGAMVAVLGTSLMVSTDIAGFFRIVDVPVGKQNVQVTDVLAKQTKTVTVTAGEVTVVDFALSPLAG